MKTTTTRVGLAWFTAETYPKLLAVADDRDARAATFVEFDAVESRRIAALTARGIEVRRILIDVDRLVEFCRARGVKIDRESIPLFVAAEMMTAHERRGCDAEGRPLDPAHPWNRGKTCH